MLGIGVLISQLTARLQSQLQDTKRRARRAAQLYHMTRALNDLSQTEVLIRRAGELLMQIFDGDAVIHLNDSSTALELKFGSESSMPSGAASIGAARGALEQRGIKIDAAGEALARQEVFVPMEGHGRIVGVLGVRPRDANRFVDADERRMLETCAGLIQLLSQQAGH